MELFLGGADTGVVLGVLAVFLIGMAVIGPKQLCRMLIRLSRRLKKLKFGPIEAEFASERDAFSTASTTNGSEAANKAPPQ